MSLPSLQPQPDAHHHLRVGAGAGVLTLLVYLTLPFTQFLANEQDETYQLIPVDYAEPPPKSVAEEIKPIEEPVPETTPPDLQDPPAEKPALAALQTNLEIGPTYASPTFLLSDAWKAPDDGELIFDLADLDKKPRLIRAGKLVYPPKLKPFKLTGDVRLLVMIRQDGSVQVVEVDKSAHPLFDRAAIQAAESSLFEIPLKDGQPVSARYYLPVHFEFQ
jgi:protein TonB